MDTPLPGRGPRTRLLIAASGYGKTTALAAFGEDAGAPVHDAARLWPRLGADPAGAVRHAGHVVVDDLHRLRPREQHALCRALAGLGETTRILLAADRPLYRAARAALPEPVLERGPADLALTADAVAVTLRADHDVTDLELAEQVHRLTRGWPALVHLAGDTLRRLGTGGDALVAAVAEPGTPGAAWVHDHVLRPMPQVAVRVLEATLDIGPLTPALVAELAAAGALPADPDRAAGAVSWLTRTGVLVPDPPVPRVRRPEALRVVPVVAEVLTRRRPRRGASAAGAGDAARRLRVAANWYEHHDDPLPAATALDRAGDGTRCLDLVRARGDDMIATGGAAEVARLLGAWPAEALDPRLRAILGDAYRVAGDVAAALRVFEPLVRQAREQGRWDPGIAWRAGRAHHLAADYAAALAVYEPAAARIGDDGRTVDEAFLLLSRASALLVLGRADDAEAGAQRGLRCAVRSGDDRAICAAHVTAALTATGSRTADHLDQAMVAAERAGDVVQLSLVLLNVAFNLLREARYPQALEAAERAIQACELGGPPGMLVTALHNAGEALLRLGRYEQAELRFRRCVQVSRRTGQRRTAMGWWGLAELHRTLGRHQESRTAFEEAIALARATGERQVLVPAMAGLARLLLTGPSADVEAARALADGACRDAPPGLVACARTAQGWVALHDADLAGGRRHAAAAIEAARSARAAEALADGLELSAAVTADLAEARAALGEALQIWQRSGATALADRVHVLLGRVPGADAAAREAARAGAARLTAIGVRAVDGSPLLPPEGATSPLRIRVLGRFEVLAGGRAVPLPAWRSRQARTLVKILVARRGRPVLRGELCELLWPDDEPERTGHRLSVILSAVRGVLDPNRVWPPDHYVRSDLAGISLDLRHVWVDAEILLRDAAHAVELARDGRDRRAREVLAAVDAMYRGDAFDDEPYEQWADGLREEVRTAWLRVLRELVAIGRAAGDPGQAVATLGRLLAADPFDESAHRDLVELLVDQGRHGEARRAYDRWVDAMREIDAPVPASAVLQARRASSY